MSGLPFDLEVMRLAAQYAHGTPETCAHQATARSRICGDICHGGLNVGHDGMLHLQMRVAACIFCQASTAILMQLHQQLEHPVPSIEELSGLDDRYALLARHEKRHGCILLPFEARSLVLTKAGIIS
jgi:hypothetical protein